MRFRNSLVLALTLSACAGTTGKRDAAWSKGGPIAPVRSEEEATAARAEFEALRAQDPARAARRLALCTYYAAELNGAIDHQRVDEAEAPFRQMLSLYSATELAGRRSAGPGDGLLLAASKRIEQSFRKRGGHAPVLAALAAQIALAPGNEANAAKARFVEVTGWLEGAQADEEMPDGSARVLDDLETIVHVFPSPFVVDELARRYRAPKSAAMRSGKPSLRALREVMGEDRNSTRAYELARLFLRVSDPQRAKAELTTLAQKAPLKGDDSELQQLLEKITGKDGTATEWVGLSMYMIRVAHERGVDDRDVALRVCRDAEARFDRAIEPRICAGKLALSLEQLVVAMRSLEQVRALDPGRRDAWEDLARIYQARLFQLVTEENLDVSVLPTELSRVEAFHAEAQKRFAQQPLQPGLAAAVFEVGRGYYNAGRIADAEKYLQRSLDLEPSDAALELLATVRLKRGDAQRAAILLERAIGLGKGGKEEQLYHRAKLRRLLAEAIEGAGDETLAMQTRRGGVDDWDVLLELGLQKEYASEGLLERGKLLYQLGEREEALRSLARSIDMLPDRGSTYADVIAFLIPRGELAEALDAYHRALGRSEVTDYLKVYCSLWINDLAQRSGQPEDPLALAYLRAADGGKWFDDLARWSTGRQTEAELIKHADTPGKRAEASFYRGLKAHRGGHPDEAKALWKEVLATDMMGFFEFDMAGQYLKEGPPTRPKAPPKPAVKRPDAERPKPKPNADPPPDGSI